MKIFKEDVIIENDTLIIKVHCSLRQHVDIPKSVYRREIDHLIPEDIKDRVVLVSSPDKKISNINSANFSNHGVWKFKILEKIKSPPAQKKVPTPRKTIKKKPLTKV
tara:strand:+ start:104 stop:424 length:321 start_codon:yes stop_codon:yes gene_type:complete